MRLARRTTSALAATLAGACAASVGLAQQVPKTQPSPELEACRSTGLIALRQTTPALKDVVFDPDGTIVAKADTKVEDTPVRTIVMGDAYLERKGSEKPYRFVCLIGDKGKVLLTFFTQQ